MRWTCMCDNLRFSTLLDCLARRHKNIIGKTLQFWEPLTYCINSFLQLREEWLFYRINRTRSYILLQKWCTRKSELRLLQLWEPLIRKIAHIFLVIITDDGANICFCAVLRTPDMKRNHLWILIRFWRPLERKFVILLSQSLLILLQKILFFCKILWTPDFLFYFKPIWESLVWKFLVFFWRS